MYGQNTSQHNDKCTDQIHHGVSAHVRTKYTTPYQHMYGLTTHVRTKYSMTYRRMYGHNTSRHDDTCMYKIHHGVSARVWTKYTMA